MNDVLLVSMPFGNVLSPSIGLSLLKAGLVRDGIGCKVRYFALDFAQLAGPAFYLGIADDRVPSVRELPGEWVFSDALFGADPEAEERYVREILHRPAGWITQDGVTPPTRALIARIRRTRGLVDGFLDACLDEVVRASPRVVGFTSVFQQHVASLALARRLKRARPETVVVFGGPNAEGAMGAETVRQFPFVDAAVSGEGDAIFPELVRRVLDGRPIDGLAGVRTRATVAADFASGRFGDAPPVIDMDSLPPPDYSDFFAQFRASRFRRSWQPRIFYESSRGCWWGEKQHCTFCGLNGGSMAYRSKSPQRAVDELAALAAAHPGCDVQVVDNILDMGYFKTVLPELAQRRLGLELFYETKANLKREHVRLLRDAGVTEIQPGVESLSDDVLRLMRKGVTALQNVRLLKWCAELGVRPYWNVLWGFPGEPPEEYARMARLAPLLSHLPPPGGIAGIRLDRFSPNFFDAERLGFVDVRPLPAYAHIYRVPDEAVRNLAYHFAFRYADGRDPSAYVPPLLDALRDWTAAHETSALLAADTKDALCVWDLRPAAPAPLTVLTGLERRLYLACDGIADLRGLAAAAGEGSGNGTTVEARLAPLVERGLLLRQGTRYLSLAMMLGEYVPPRRTAGRVFELARRLGTASEPGLRVPLGPLDVSRGVLVPRVSGRRTRSRETARSAPKRPARAPSRLTPAHFCVDAREMVLVAFSRPAKGKEV